MKRQLTPLLLFTTLAQLAAVSASAQNHFIENRHGQSCWVIRNGQVELSLTRLGGHVAPVTFYRGEAAPVRPYHISPWQGETHNYPVPVLAPLRGDFFCLPFGGNGEAYNGENHPPHGEVAGSEWSFVSAERNGPATTLTVTLKTAVRTGQVTKKLHLLDGQNVIYSTHVIEGFAGKTPLGHHATLAMPEQEGAIKISHSPMKFGLTYPGQFSNPANGEYQQLEPGARIARLNEVQSIFRSAPDADVTRLPQKRGYADLLAIFARDDLKHPAWLTAVRADEGWLWFSLKDPHVLPATVFWLENRGRHGLPWFGRNNCVGLEDVCAYFADGVAASARDNLLTRQGIKTAHELQADRPFAVNYIQGVARVPRGFTEVKDVEFAGGIVTFVSTGGHRVVVPVRHEFLQTGAF